MKTDYTRIFYWLTVADNARSMFMTFVVLFTAISVIATICYLFNMENSDECEENRAVSTKWMWRAYPFMILFWSLYVFTPSKKDALLIVAGGGTLNFLTTDTVAKQIPHELSRFVVTELKNMAKDSEVNLNIQNQKDKILEEAKNMTAKEVIERIKTDSVFAKIVTEK